MRILYTGDIVGNPGRRAFVTLVPKLREELELDAVVANGENAAAGRGITPDIAEALLSAGADVITLGDHTWDQRDTGSLLDRETRIVRPANFPPGNPGRGLFTFGTPKGAVTVIQVIGRVFMQPHYDCPFRTADQLAKAAARESRVVLVEIHAEATSEKIALGHYLDGRVSAVVGTHTHVPTADERIFPKGTAYISDLGMTGPRQSVIGREIDPVLHKFITGMPARFDVANEDVVMEGVVLDIDEFSGKARGIERIRQVFQ